MVRLELPPTMVSAARQAQHGAEQGPGLGQPVQAAVVAGVGAVPGEEVALQYAIQRIRQGHLLGAGLAPGDIQGQAEALQLVVLRL